MLASMTSRLNEGSDTTAEIDEELRCRNCESDDVVGSRTTQDQIQIECLSCGSVWNRRPRL